LPAKLHCCPIPTQTDHSKSPPSEQLRGWKFFLSRTIKVGGFLIALAITVFLAVITFKTLAPSEFEGAEGFQLIAVPFFLILTLLSAYITWISWENITAPNSVTKHADDYRNWLIDLLSAHTPAAASKRVIAAIISQWSNGDFKGFFTSSKKALEKHQDDIVLLILHAFALVEVNDRSAVNLWDRIYSSISEEHSAIRGGVFVERLGSRLRFKEFAGLSHLLNEFVILQLDESTRIRYMDQLACNPIYSSDAADPEALDFAEACIGKALALAPDLPTLHGTLGGILAERAAFADAEIHLRKCLEGSEAAHDQAISSYFLATVAEHRNERQHARELVERAVMLYPEDWLKMKADGLLRRLNDKRGPVIPAS